MNVHTVVNFLSQEGLIVATIAMCLSATYFELVRNPKLPKLQNRLFTTLMLNVLVCALCNLISNFAKPYAQESSIWRALLVWPQFIYYVFHSWLAALFCFYISVVTSAYHSLKAKYRHIYQIPMYVTLAVVLSNPFTHVIFHFDEVGGYHRGPGAAIVYITSGIYFIFAIAIMFAFWNAIQRRLKRVMTFFFITSGFGIALQAIFPELRIELYAEALALTGIMVILENEEGRKDSRTGIYNHAALSYDITRYMRVRKSFFLICLKMRNPASMMQMVGPANIEKLTELTCDFLTSLVPKHFIYYIGTGTFVILNENSDRDFNLKMARAINDRFKEPWHFLERDTVFEAMVFCAEIPTDLQSYKDVSMLVNGPAVMFKNPTGDVFYGKGLDFIMRRSLVENAVISGLKRRMFEVYYQPIYNAKDMTVCAGEALVRLHTDKLGDIYPDEFIPVIERSGLIFELGEFVLEEVCKFLSSGIPVEMGIETLNINLSVVQCMQANYAEQIINTVSKYDIAPSRINFEITEHAASFDFDVLHKFVKTLISHGFHFSMDDYGTGYSNIQALFTLDVDIIKIDRTILWDAEQTENGRIVMESTIDMIRRMKRKILVSGVENRQQIEMLAEFDVDYLQGFYFSNPLNQNEFISILKATQIAKIEEQKAIAASESMSNFLANMSHEIRTPINAVLGMDELILRESGDDKIQEYAKVIEGAGKTLLSLINDILDFSKIEAGSLEITEAPYDLSSMIMDVVNMISIKAKQKGLTLLLDTDSSTPDQLFGDEMRLRQVLLNILNNAIKYTEKGTVTLKVGFDRKDKKRLDLILAVRDTGIGIKEKDLDKLFEKFQRLDLEKNKTIEGSGLGLAITKRIVEKMNGRITVESVYGRGSTFTVRIPQVVMADSSIGNLRGKMTKPAEKENKLSHQPFIAPDARILVVDDTPVNHMVVRELLKTTKVKIDEAKSGEEGLDLAFANQYDLILLDYRMPIMDGIQTLKKLKEKKDGINIKTPVVALTANAIAGARAKFISEGFDDYITKPVASERLEEALLMYIPTSKIQFTDGDIGGDDGSKEEVTPHEYDNLISVGIENCGSQESYEKVFAAFQNEIEKRVKIIRDSLEAKDYDRYEVEVHSIKSSARIIGANKLSSLAENLETAAGNREIEFIENSTDELLKMYESFKKKEEKEEEKPEVLMELDESGWKDALNTMKEFVASMDYDNFLNLIGALRGYDVSDERKKFIADAESLVYDLKWEELTDMIEDNMVAKDK